MNPPTLHKWIEGNPDFIRDVPEPLESKSFKLNETDIKFQLVFYPISEYSDEHCALYLRITNWDDETSITVQFRFWLENCIGEKLMDKPFEMAHAFTHDDDDDNEDIGSKRFISHDKLFSPTFDFRKYGSITFCCEILRIKSDIGFLADFDFRENTHSLYLSGITGNCTLKTIDKDFPISKNLLAASSHIFENMFRSNTQENKNGIVNFEDISTETIEKFIEYLHVGKVKEIDEAAENLFKLASRYSIGNLKEICVKSLADTFSKENIVRRLKMSFESEDAELKNHALFYITNYSVGGNFRQILESVEWKELLPENPELANKIAIAYFSGTKSL